MARREEGERIGARRDDAGDDEARRPDDDEQSREDAGQVNG
jgi:hypothetical protein